MDQFAKRSHFNPVFLGIHEEVRISYSSIRYDKKSNAMNWNFVIQILTPVLAAFLGAGGIGAYYVYKGNRPKTAAEAQKMNAEVLVTFADGWKNYAEKMEEKNSLLEKENNLLRERITLLEQELIKYKDKELKLDVARTGLHKAVDENIDEIKNEDSH
jgi:hypothetical protein